jgi:hypothetical protein
MFSLGSRLARGPAHMALLIALRVGTRSSGSMHVCFSVVSVSPEWDKEPWEIDTDFLFFRDQHRITHNDGCFGPVTVLRSVMERESIKETLQLTSVATCQCCHPFFSHRCQLYRAQTHIL